MITPEFPDNGSPEVPANTAVADIAKESHDDAIRTLDGTNVEAS